MNRYYPSQGEGSITPAWGFSSSKGNGIDIPFMYDFINAEWGRQSPNTVHCKNTCLHYFWAEQLMQRAMSVLKWKLPEEINPYYFKWTLNTFGYIGLFNQEKFGHMALLCGFQDYDPYYYPKKMLFANPLFEKTEERTINKDGVLLNLRGDFSGFVPSASLIADQLALLCEDAGVSMVNMKLANVFACDNRNGAQSFKRMFDQIASGDPAVFVDKNLFDEQGNPRWFNFQSGMKNNYIIGDLMVDIRKCILLFDDLCGIPSINTEKRERMVTAEAEANQDEARSALEMWLDDIKKECKRAKELLDFDISVELRHKDDPVEYENNEQKGGTELNES